ncbi:MAG: Ig-like domain-containing protein, partial [Cyclobacteriaceae bacterium]
ANPLSWITFVESKDGGAFIGTPSASHAGTNSFQITVSDGGLSASQTVEIFVSYAAFTTIEDQTIIEGATFDALDLSTYLTVFGDINTYWQVAGQNQLTAAVSENTLTVTTPNSDWFGNETLTVNLVNQDNDEVLDSQEVTYQVNNVNDAPVITSTPTSTASIGVYYTYAITAQDVDGDALTLSAVNLPSWLTFVAGSNGATVLGKPSIEDAGNHQFQISLTDGAETIMQDVTILVASASIQGLEGQVIEEGNSFASIDLNNFVAIFGDISISWEVSSGQELIPTIDESNLLSVAIPNEDWFGSESFTLSIVDSNLTWDETVIIFTVNNVNDAPVLTVAPNTNAVKGEYFETKVEYFDADNDLLSFELIDAPSWLSKIDQSSGFTLYGIADDSENLGFEVKVSDNSSDIVLNIVLEVVTILSSSTVQDLEAYPNPTINRLNFNASQDVTHIQVIDMFGRIMLEEKSSANYIDVDQLSEGQYLLRYVLGGESKSMKFIKK